jgi:hypothetical protein
MDLESHNFGKVHGFHLDVKERRFSLSILPWSI